MSVVAASSSLLRYAQIPTLPAASPDAAQAYRDVLIKLTRETRQLSAELTTVAISCVPTRVTLLAAVVDASRLVVAERNPPFLFRRRRVCGSLAR